mmetsp:Transcript_6899/g.17443  ORF Transcript_6899/g.17443 Transcript_6899/m.17443 type:complete len:82 (-) Transcript_6899:21-266(-)
MLRGNCTMWISGKAPPSPKSSGFLGTYPLLMPYAGIVTPAISFCLFLRLPTLSSPRGIAKTNTIQSGDEKQEKLGGRESKN